MGLLDVNSKRILTLMNQDQPNDQFNMPLLEGVKRTIIAANYHLEPMPDDLVKSLITSCVVGALKEFFEKLSTLQIGHPGQENFTTTFLREGKNLYEDHLYGLSHEILQNLQHLEMCTKTTGE